MGFVLVLVLEPFPESEDEDEDEEDRAGWQKSARTGDANLEAWTLVLASVGSAEPPRAMTPGARKKIGEHSTFNIERSTFNEPPKRRPLGVEC